MALSGYTHGGNYRRLTRATTSQVWSFLAWVYPTSSPAQYSTPMESRDGSSSIAGFLYSGTSWTVCYTTNSADYGRNTGLAAVTNAWQMLCGTVYTGYALNKVTYVLYRGYAGSITSDTWETLVSGVDVAKTITNYVQYDTAQGNRQFVGRIALCAVWDAVLTSGQVTDLYNAGAGVDPATIQAANIRISNYFDDTQLGINGDTNGGTYTDFGSLTTVDGPFSAAATLPKFLEGGMFRGGFQPLGGGM